MAAQKCKNLLFQTIIKKVTQTKNSKFVKLSLLQDHTEENARMRILESYFCLQMIKILLHGKFSEKT